MKGDDWVLAAAMLHQSAVVLSDSVFEISSELINLNFNSAN